jgi:hypothetical protein
MIDGTVGYECQECKDLYEAEKREIDKLRKAGRLQISLPLPNAAELVLEDLKRYLEGGNHQEILEALLRFAKARGVTLPNAPDKCSIHGCTKDAVHRQQISGDVFLLCDEHYRAMFQVTLCNVPADYRMGVVYPCSEFGCQERATHRFQFNGVIRNMCAAHFYALFKFLEPPTQSTRNSGSERNHDLCC